MSQPASPLRLCGQQPGVRRAGLPEAEARADAGPAPSLCGGAVIFTHGQIRQRTTPGIFPGCPMEKPAVLQTTPVCGPQE